MSVAEEFCRREIRRWDALGCSLSVSSDISMDGAYVFTLHSERGRLGGAFPVVVDTNSGSCRFIEGMEEYKSLRSRNRS